MTNSKKILSTLILLSNFCLSSSSFAKVEQFTPYFESLEKEYLMNTDHLFEISEHIFLAAPSILNRYVFSTDAAATYNGILNTISLDPENFIEDGDLVRIKTKTEMNHKLGYNSFQVKTETIFHELAHADFDVIIEEDEYHELYTLLRFTIPNWFKEFRPGINAKTATHELFGYTAGNFISVMNYKLDEVLFRYGIKPIDKSCFSERARRKIYFKAGLDKGLEFTWAKKSEDFTEDIIPSYIFISGKDVDMQGFPRIFNEQIIRYFANTYNLPTTSEGLIHKLNSSWYSDILRSCYADWLK